ncbi:adenylate/guanylate cyclase domain-containing protein [Mesorhizobium sp.]|uniref:adenylate/guanylate cyclase domain-containing protein n=1 Tax=Mesorhizobium sp. TaxID=1871066 RepID=UPI000FE9C5F6|nr:adenylate/guanylate cyclase domain-containing protein [Mesorhizobium sp.]RWE59374.1 MAG: adenylate/guanylate cyclase domain-containing protein [Mesorhizobium sp.]
MQRRLAAILAADVVGYSRLMEADEADTLARLKSTRENLIDPKITAHKGRIVKLMGDGALVEFSSVVDAVSCAVEIQETMAECNAELPKEKQLEFRIGVNLGDVIVEGQDIYGDGVNVAARLEEMAEPGGVLISGTAFDQVERKLGFDFKFLGEKQVKNIEKPVRLYRVGPRARAPSGTVPAKRKPHVEWRRLTVAAMALILVAAGVALWNVLGDGSGPPVEVASKARMVLPLPDKPSIAVLPFTNMSNEAGQETFTDGMTDDLITDLSKVSGLFVIARNSTFAYRGKPVKISQVAEELGVRYVLEGSVRRAGEQVRVNAQLIDTLSGGHVWADRFDGNVADIFAVQDVFVAKIVEALKVNLTTTEKTEIARAKPDNIAAKEAFEEGWSLYLRYTAKDTAAAITSLKKATEFDPEYGRAYAALALAYFRVVESLWGKELGRDEPYFWWGAHDYVELANKFPTSLSYTVEALRAVYQGLAEDARRNAGRAIALDPNDPEAHIATAWALTISGEPAEALNFVATAMRLNPNYPSHYVLARGLALFATGDLKQAAEVFGEGVRRNPDATALFLPFSSVLAQLGRREQARQMLLKFRPGLDQKGLENLLDTLHLSFKWDYEHASVRERLNDGVRIAALPLDVTVTSLEAELETGNPFSQQYAAKRLGWFGPAALQAVPALVEALKVEYLRREAIEALGKIGPPAQAAIPALAALQNEALVGIYAKDALSKIRGN